MNENLDLTKILEGLDNRKLYSSIHGVVFLEKIYHTIIGNSIIFVKKDNYSFEYYRDEESHKTYYNGKQIFLFPSKDQRDWSKFKRPLKKGTPVVCSDYNSKWYIAYYSRTVCNIQFVTLPNSTGEHEFNYVIPFDKFNPNNIEDSIKKYNIQKL